MMTTKSRSKLQWVKLMQAEIFWPCCVYESYSDALVHLHDVSNLRDRKPALDPEDRVLYFFGVAENLKCGKSHGSTPNIQMCVIHDNDFIAVPWNSTDTSSPEEEFEEISRKYHINQGQFERTKQNYFLKTAIVEAQEYYTADSHQQAIKVFVSFLRKRQQKIQGKQVDTKGMELCRKLDYTVEEENNQMEEVEQAEHVDEHHDDHAAVDDVVMAEEMEDVATKPVTPSSPASSVSNDGGSFLQSWISSVADKLWSKMLAFGWETMHQTGATMLYKMPNTSFFHFKPNVNIFDSKEQACIKYVTDLLSNKASDPDEQAFVCDLLWQHMEARGWISMKSNKEECFMMPNIQFNQYIPNVTIFASKAQAVAKFLQPPSTSTSTPSAPSTQPQGNKPSSTCSSSASEEEGEDMEQEVICIDDESDNAASFAPQRSQEKTSASARTKVVKRKTKASIYRPKPPKFILKLGMLENELRNRGWYWKRGGKLHNYLYFRPETKKNAKLTDLVEDFDFFRSSDAMIQYLEDTGLYQEIELKLRIAHEKKYGVHVLSDSETEMYRRPTFLTQKSRSSSNGTANGGTSRKHVRSESKKRPVPSSSVSSSSSSKAIDTAVGGARQVRGDARSTRRKPVTFGRIQAKLVARGWTFRPGKFEYDYFAPGYTKVESVPNVNYFQSSLLLENYLKETGLWQEIEEEIHLEEEERSKNTPPQKKIKTDTKAKHKPCESVRAVIERKKAKLLEEKIALSSDSSYDEEEVEVDVEEEATALSSEAEEEEEEEKKTVPRSKKETLTSRDTAASTDTVLGPILAEFNQLMSSTTTTAAVPKPAETATTVVSTNSATTTPTVSTTVAKAPIQEKKKQQVSTEKGKKTTDNEPAKWSFHTPQRSHPVVHQEVAVNTAVKYDQDDDDMEETQVLFDDRENKSNAISPDGPELKMTTASVSVGGVSSTPPFTSSSMSSAKENAHLARNIAASFTPSPPIVKKKIEQENKSKSCSMSISELVDTAIKQLSPSFLDDKSETTIVSQTVVLKYREQEFTQIQEFLKTSFQPDILKGSLYISGAPGCGKTALLRSAQGNILDLWQSQGNDAEDFQMIHLNAMGLKDSNRLFGTLASTISGRKEYLASEMKNAFQYLEQAILFGHANENQRTKTVLLVLDEMDIFLNKNTYCQDLYRLFQLAHQRPTTGKIKTALILVGIANSVDLTERHLPHLRLHLGCTPKVIIFKAYSYQAIEKILIDRLGGPQVYKKLVSSHGVSFLARKLASSTGDIRTALDVTRRILQQRRVSQGTKWEPVPLAEMVKSIKTALESKGSQTIQSLPRNLQMILFACTRLVQVSSFSSGVSGSSEVYPLGDLYRTYCDLTKEAGIYQPLTSRDFRQALDVLSSEGLLGAQELKKNQLIKLLFSPSEVVQMFRQDPFFARFS